MVMGKKNTMIIAIIIYFCVTHYCVFAEDYLVVGSNVCQHPWSLKDEGV